MKSLCLYFYMVLLMFLIKWNLDIWSKFTFNLAAKGLNHIHVRMCSKGKMKGAQCSEPVKSKVPCIWFVLKSKHFTVAQQQKLGTRGHQALLEHRSAHVCIPMVFLLKRWNKIKDWCHLTVTLVHNKAGCPYYRGKACLLRVSLGLTQLSVIELCLNSYFEVIVLSLL